MGNGIQLLFNPFVLDTSNQSPLRGTKKIVLTPKIFAVPDFLLRNSHLLVAKTEVVATLWPETKVVDVAFRFTIRKIRKTLNDNAKFPKFIETVPCEVTPSNQVARPYQHIMVGRPADSISSGYTENQGATQYLSPARGL